MEWTRSETLALASTSCAFCRGMGLRGDRKGAWRPCSCVFRAIFRACYARFRESVEKDRHLSQVRLEFSPSGGHHVSWGRKDEEYIADFYLVSKRTLSPDEWPVFNCHFLLGADWRLCCRRLKIERGYFFHCVYRIENKLGRTYRELTPYALFPLDEYFNGRTVNEPPATGPNRLPLRGSSLSARLNVPVRRAARPWFAACARPHRAHAGSRLSTILGVDLTRRSALISAVSAAALPSAQAAEPIDRQAVVARHHPLARAFDPLGPLSVGNGEFAFTFDATGLQTFPELYEAGIPLCTQSQWGWHSRPAPVADPLASYRLSAYDTHGRPVLYPTGAQGQQALYDWLRENPHRLNLARIGLRLLRGDGSVAHSDDVKALEQRLELWTGVATSRFEFDGQAARVELACHPRLDQLGVVVESPLLASGRLQVEVAFPYASPAVNASDWDSPDQHSTRLQAGAGHSACFERALHDTRYFVSLRWDAAAALEPTAPHRFRLSSQSPRLAFSCLFSAATPAATVPDAAEVLTASRRHWPGFWNHGGAVDFAGSRDARSGELERRVVLSQYLTAIQCSGSLPPQETGLTCNSWYGKFHLEMHWWHAVHFAYWNRLPLLERSLGYYGAILDSARRTARGQGYTGARWPKMTARDGRDSPSPIGPLLIWQQPHPIYYAELCRRARPERRTLEQYREIVFETAEFMAAFAWRDPARALYVLGPPVIPAQENHPPRETWNPTYELAYWRWGLEIAQRWREALGLSREPRWEAVRTGLAPLPVADGVYLAHENCPQTYSERNRDHPSMLMALGFLPGDGADPATMRRTLRRVMAGWKWPDTWGWDYPMVAMTAARLGEPAIAVDALLLETPKNRYLFNGHNYQRPGLHLYLPGNGGLLTAIAMMAAGWDGGPQQHAPGFPAAGWSVRWENLRRVI